MEMVRAATGTAISVHNLTVSVREKRRNKALLSNINFEVEEGKFIAVIGASGCGKSTLIKALAGLIVPTAGKILLAGHQVEELNEHLPLAVGYLPQFGAFHEQLTVGENLETAVALRLPNKVSSERRQTWMRNIIELADRSIVAPGIQDALWRTDAKNGISRGTHRRSGVSVA